MPKTSVFSNQKEKLSLIIAIFILSVFAGIILSLIVKQWIIGNENLIKKAQIAEESKKINSLLDKLTF